MKRKLVYLIVLVALVLFSGTDTPWAQARPLDAPHTDVHQGSGFTTASLQGSYAAIGLVGANEGAVVGICHLDGNGSFDCAFTTNVPGEEAGARAVFPATSAGEYTVNADGTGTLHEIETLPDGSTAEYDHDFVITHADAIGPYVVATEIRSLIRQGFGPAGSLAMAQLTRLPDVGTAPAMAAEPAMPATMAAERLQFVFMVANRSVGAEGEQVVINGRGTFDPDNLADIEGNGTYFHFNNAAEGVPKPLAALGAGRWRVKQGVAFTPIGSYAMATAGVLDLVVELMPEDGEPVEATLRVICNVPPAGLFNQGEDGSNLPEGVVLEVPGVETFEPIVSDQPGVPTFGLTLIGQAPAGMVPAVSEAEQRIFRVVSVSDAGVDADGVHHRIALSGDGKFTANHVNASGTFVHFDQAPEGTPKPILASGNWKARKVLSYSGSLGAAGGIDAGILEVEVDLFPEGGSAITGILRVVCNIGFAGIMTGEPEGYKLTIPGQEGSPGLTFVPLDPVLGLTHIGAPGAR